MPRSSFSDNPLLRVSRPVSACSRCRAAKVKCDGKLPACTACEKAGRESECSAANDQFARGKERSYVAALELRIEKLERRLNYARSRKASVALHEQEAPPFGEQERKDSLATIRAAIHRKAARKRENSDVNSLVSEFGFLSVNATTRDFEPSSSNMTFARLVLAAAINDPTPEPKSPKLPPRQAAIAVIDYYEANIYALFPIFSLAQLHTALDELYQQDQRPVSSVNKWLVYMVLAVGSMAQSRSRDDEFYNNGVEFVSHALKYADRALMPGYITQIQSLTLLTQYAMLDPAHFDAWHLIGFACRAVVDLGFHQDPPSQGQTDRAVLDMRRKTFYCVYALDRAISMVHARAFSFTDDAVNVAFPSMSGIGRLASISTTITFPQSHSPAILLFQLRRMQSHWYQTLIQSDPNQPIETLDGDSGAFIWQMCHDMREWAESLPETLPVGIRELFDLELRYSYVYCMAPSARAPHMTPYGRMLIFEHAIAYLDRIFGIAHAAPNPNPAFYTSHDALRVYFMGSQFMAVLREAGDTLLSGHSVPVPLSLPGKAPPPPIPVRTGQEDNLTRSLRCLESVSLTLKKYGERWADAESLMTSFDMISTEMIADLKTRMTRDSQQAQQAQMHTQHHQHQHQHSHSHSQNQLPQQQRQQHHQQQHQQHNQQIQHQHQQSQHQMHQQHQLQQQIPMQPVSMQPQMHPGQQYPIQMQHPMQHSSPPLPQGQQVHHQHMGSNGPRLGEVKWAGADPRSPPMSQGQQQQQQVHHQHLGSNGPSLTQIKWLETDINQMGRGGGF